MLFGDAHRFAVEAEHDSTHEGQPYGRFRFWVGGRSYGDWAGQIPLNASLHYAREFNRYSQERIDPTFATQTAEEIWSRVYDAFFSTTYSKPLPPAPTLRDRFHLDGIGMGSTVDRHGFVLVSPTSNTSRLIVKNLVANALEQDRELPFGFVEEVLEEYIAWGSQLNRNASGSEQSGK